MWARLIVIRSDAPCWSWCKCFIFQERSVMVLNVMQEMRSTVSAAERAYMAEVKDMENYADRVQVC